MASDRIPLHEKFAYGLGNFLPTAVTATGGMAMFFYTDIAGLSAAFIGTLLLAVRVIDAGWDIWVGRRVDATRTRMGQARPYLLWFAPLLALALLASFTVPSFEGGARTAWFVIAYVLLWCCYSLVQIPFQTLLPLVAPDPDERLRTAGVNSFVQFLFVVGCGAGFPMLKDALSDGDPAQGFQRAAMLFAGLGLVLTWLCFAGVRERSQQPRLDSPPDLRSDLRALLGNRAWRGGVLSQCVLSALIGIPLASGVYLFSAVLGQPQMIGPFMGLGGLGLVLGVVMSDQLTRRLCKRQVYVGAMLTAAVAWTGFLLVADGPIQAVLALSLLANLFLGISAPISFSMNGDIADDIEHACDRRVVGTLVATINFSNKVGAGLGSAIVGGVLAFSGYVGGAAQQDASAQQGIVALMSVIPAALALIVALVIGGVYPLGRDRLTLIHRDLAARRADRASAPAEGEPATAPALLGSEIQPQRI